MYNILIGLNIFFIYLKLLKILPDVKKYVSKRPILIYLYLFVGEIKRSTARYPTGPICFILRFSNNHKSIISSSSYLKAYIIVINYNKLIVEQKNLVPIKKLNTSKSYKHENLNLINLNLSVDKFY